MKQKKYWQSFAERTNNEAFQEANQNEFKEELTVEDSKNGILDATTPRRDFLKYLGFSTAAAALAASCETPVKKAIPYLNKPENMIPGVADFYATTYVSGGDAIPVLAKVRDGRPIKIEGNTASTIFKGGTSAQVQASVLDLYDTSRLRYPMQKAGDTFKEVSSFEAMDKIVMDGLRGLSNSQIALLTSTITSPSTLQAIAEFKAKYPNIRHVQYDGVSYSGMLEANYATYGKWAIPTYLFENAKVIVSLGADFLGTWLSPIEFQQGYSKNRKINEKNPQMSKHYQFESMMSMTGANADERFTHRPSHTGAVAVALLVALGDTSVPKPKLDAKLQAAIDKVAAELLANTGAGLVVCGSNDVNIQIVVNAINGYIGAYGDSLALSSKGAPIQWGVTTNTKQGIDAEFAQLLADMESGKVGALLVYDANPAYDYFDAERFKKALSKVQLAVSFGSRMDETTELCKYIIPVPHYLESWGDAEPKKGYYCYMQPVIAPLFKTRPFAESLLKWSGNDISYEAYFKQSWDQNKYISSMQNGVGEPDIPLSSVNEYYPRNGAAIIEAAKKAVNKASNSKAELVLYQNVAMGDGRHPNNPWLLELPDPITKATWDNYALVSPVMAKELLGIDITKEREANNYEFFPEKPVIKIKAGGKELTLPALIIPGMQSNTIAVAVGYGRGEKLGKAANGVGKNAFPLAVLTDNNVDWIVPNVTVEKTGETYKIAQTQIHGSYEGRHEVVRELTFNDFKHNPTEILDERKKELEPFGGIDKFVKSGTLYPYHEKPGIKWGMSIDLNACYGCGACVVACHIENNVPVVGKSEVLRSHEMHWLRIDRYFAGDPNDADSIQTVFQPMLCQHCDNAPCENVCPVAATPHSSEGLNQMTYNRCIGTRYCANNCPYKVRRFNWADYLGADSFKNNQDKSAHLDDAVLMMNDELTRMVLNPDVTVRSRGVMEKCSFCVQRLQAGKLQAKKESRPLQTGNVQSDGTEAWDVQTACQQACSAGAIVFGNVNDRESAVSKSQHSNANRLFYVLEPLHTLPNISYLAKVRNTDKLSAGKELKESKETLPSATETHG